MQFVFNLIKIFLHLGLSSFNMIGKEDTYYSNELNPKTNAEAKHNIGLKETTSAKEEKLKDQNLWLKLRLGSEEAFKELFLKYNGILIKYGNSIFRDPFIIEDCIHDLFLYLWSKKESLTEVDSVKYYLFVSFRRRVFKVLSEKEKGIKLLEGIKHEFPKHEDFFEKIFIERQNTMEREISLKKAVDELSPRQKEVLHLRYIEGLPYQEISMKMGISNVSARKLSSKGIKNLRKNF